MNKQTPPKKPRVQRKAKPRANAKPVPQAHAARRSPPADSSAGTETKPRGRPFQKGQSGNPGGRPAIPEHVREACRALTETAVETLKSVMTDKGAPAAARVSAANAVLDRAWGKPESDVRVGGLPGAPPIATASVDLKRLRPEDVYAHVMNGAPLPDDAQPDDEAEA